ncbi:DUF4350 domain-containing protein [Segatella hominis]|uniref:DUF4350 domain-containing protein n=2 Tax=Segatella hominis TaxID=2518605 RepID=A0A4Y8VNI1_9BACT|nr:DUF4350 domain-containing protein [Segatella hominis]TFH81946.1 DUF4350 domain-containing protein [Segatella hominis]
MMKSSRNFLFVMLVLFVLFCLLQVNLPKKFVWSPTFSHVDKQPLGCFVFDSVLTQSLPNGYHVTKKTFFQLDQEHAKEKISVLMVVDQQNLKQLDVKYLCNIARRGGKVMVVASSSFDDGRNADTVVVDELERTFNVRIEDGTYFSLRGILAGLKAHDNDMYDTIYWNNRETMYAAQSYRMFYNMVGGTLFVDSVPKVKRLAYTLSTAGYDYRQDSLYVGDFTGFDTIVDEKERIERIDTFAIKKVPTAVSVPYGKGEVIFVSSPLLFTNYGMLEGNTFVYIFRLMSYLADLPVYRTEAYVKTDAMLVAEQSPFREFIKRPPLRWALYLALLGVVLFMIFTARRRQRVIPILSKPANRSLEFIQLIGTLYYQRKDHVDLVRKKFKLFAEELRKTAGVDISDVNTDDREYLLLAEKTGMNSDRLKKVIRQIRLVLHSEGNISVEEMRSLIDAMDTIVRHAKNG